MPFRLRPEGSVEERGVRVDRVNLSEVVNNAQSFALFLKTQPVFNAQGLPRPHQLCAPGRGRYFTKEDSANLVVLYNNAETISGVYLRSDSEMPAPWKKTGALKGGGGIEIINQEHWGLYTFFNDPIQACQRPDAKSVGTGGTHYQGPKAVRSEYKPTPTPAPILGLPETIAKISEGLSSDTKTFKIVNTTDESDVATGITSSQIAQLLSSLTEGSQLTTLNISPE